MKKIMLFVVMLSISLAGYSQNSEKLDHPFDKAVGFIVLGEVAEPMPFYYYPEYPGQDRQKLTIVRAIAIVGGFTKNADKKNVIIRRTGEDGKVSILTVNVRNILTSADAVDVPIQDGDIIYVREDTI